MTHEHPAGRWIGAPLNRTEDRRLLTGGGRFLDDIPLPGALHAAFLRSPHAHARVLAVDAAAARDLPGVVAVYSGADLPGRPIPMLSPHPAFVDPVRQPVLAREYVSHLGEPVACVVAESRYAAEDALEAIAVQYDPLPAVVDLGAAAAGGPLAHPGRPDNIVARLRTGTGDVAAAFAAAYRVVERELRTHRGMAQPMEGRGVAATLADGVLTVWAGTQAPYRLRSVLAALLDWPEAQIRVISPDVGGGFGQKGPVYPEDVAVAFAALRLGRPVRWFEDRREHFVGAAQERDQIHRVAVAVDREGHILALRDHFLHDAGAYVPHGSVVPVNTLFHLPGPYRIPAIELEGTVVYTNLPSVAPYRGAGRPEGNFVCERMLDAVAAELGLDPVEVRRRNLVPPEQMPYDTGLRLEARGSVVYDSGDFGANLDKLLALVDVPAFRRQQAEARRQGRHLGLGTVCFVEASGSGPFEGAKVKIDAGGAVCVYSPTGDSGQGHETAFAQIAADVLGVTPGEVQVITGDTDTLARGIGTFGSRTAAVAGSAVYVAAGQVREQILAIAAELLGEPPAALSLEGGAVRTPDGRTLTLARIARAAQRAAGAGAPPLEATHYFEVRQSVWPSGACAAVVAVDPDTGFVRVQRMVMVHDCGVVLNPKLVAGQVDGGIAQGIGGALLEELVYDEQGQLLTASFMDYLLPTAAETAPVEHGHRVTPTPHNPLGVKGSGESGAIPVAAAIAQAIEDALGGAVRIDRIPVTPQRLWDALQAR